MFRKHYFFCCLVMLALFVPLAAGAVFDRNLSLGAQGDDVRQLQEWLAQDPQIYLGGKITGYYGVATRGAVVLLQKREGIMPASGFFGPLTRARINVLLQDKVVQGGDDTATMLQNDLLSQILVLQARLVVLRAQLAAEQQTPPVQATTTHVVSPIPVASSTPLASPAPILVSEVRISGSFEQLFPNTMITPLKIGDIAIANTTANPVAFVQLELDIHDGMNSTLNRNKTVEFIVRNGTSTSDTLISKTNFVINNDPPPVGGSFRRQVKLSFPITLASATNQSFGLWIESLDYVVNGSLIVELYQSYVTSATAPVGGFRFALTR
ncbi:MAG: peptidoglycan-binding protein [Candidatus Sungbacteria bacterium]|nr:peptidoglycan-binding protein [Candidatus Sungbacteria bacterium]